MSGDRYKIADQEEVYFLTLTVIYWMDVFTKKDYKIIVVDALNYCIENKGLEVFAYVIMSNHLHMIARAKEGYKLSEILRDFKKFTSKAIVKRVVELSDSRCEWLINKFAFEARRSKRAKYYKFWMDDNHAISLARRELIAQKLNYIHQNPVKQMIVSNPVDYLFSSAIDYADGKGFVNISHL